MTVPTHGLPAAALLLLRSWLACLSQAWRSKIATPFAAALAAVCLAISPVGSIATAQEADDASDGQGAEEAEEEGEDLEVVTVTGSRLKRDTYSSIAPLQIITAEVSREAGLVDAVDIVQQSTASAGFQVDLTFIGFVADNGPGTATANLRGLGAGRTLVLINGRRVAPAGVEGAPQSPSLDIIPSLLVSNYDQLLDGASSVYGSDAVAGVVNAVLAQDFDGLQFEAFPRYSEHGAGREEFYGARWGRNFERGFIGMGAQYSHIEPITLADRPWTAGCDRHYEVDQNGQIRQDDLFNAVTYGMESDGCRAGLLASRFWKPDGDGWVYYTPGYSNGGWNDWSESNLFRFGRQFGLDGDGDGRTDVNWRNHDFNGRTQFRHLRAERTTANFMSYGQYTFEGEANLTPYFEVLYSNRQGHSNEGVYRIGIGVPAGNPFNPCNPQGAGVDCGLAHDALYTNSDILDQLQAHCASEGIALENCTTGNLTGATGAVPTFVQFGVLGDRVLTYSDITQMRYVAGLRGDLPMLNIGPLYDWSFDVSLVHSESSGTARRPGIREDRLDLALGWHSVDHNPCEANIDDAERARRAGEKFGAIQPLVADSAQGCVPVNLFSGALHAEVIGDFATGEEHNYLFDQRDFDTKYAQSMFSAYMTGTLFDLPSGPVNAGLGVEYRIDEITSIPDNIAREGLFYGFFVDRGAEGDKYTREAFGEVEMPLNIAGTSATVNLSARWTDDEFYGGAWTGAAKMGWNPVNSLLLRATYGTSYRAPSLRELFLRDQTGFLNLFDPCVVPDNALDENGEYVANLDERDPVVLQNCSAQGVDPTTLDNNGFSTYNVEIASAGTLDLEEETSESMSAGFVWEQPFTNAFDFAIGASYYDISVENTIISPSAQYIINDCYNSETGNSAFCGRISRTNEVGLQPLVEYIDAGFINRDREFRRGVDVNLTFAKTLRIVDQPVGLEFDLALHRQIEVSDLIVNDEGVENFQQFHREWFFPEYRAQMGMRATINRWSVSWRTRFQGRVSQDEAFTDPFSDLSDSNDTGFVGDTCFGPPTDVLCRDIDSVGDYWVHNASARYRADIWELRFGASNVLDTPPPQVDGNERWNALNNTARFAGYDVLGRTFFLGVFVDIGRS